MTTRARGTAAEKSEAHEHGRTPREAPVELNCGEEAREWDLVDEQAWESFPSSDPPANWAGADIPAALQHAHHTVRR